jgi:hypothetical protein
LFDALDLMNRLSKLRLQGAEMDAAQSRYQRAKAALTACEQRSAGLGRPLLAI